VSKIKINNIEYNQEKLSTKAKHYLSASQETHQKKIKTLIELERCDVLLKYYDEKIQEELKSYKE
jgi:hypothetical protein